MRRRRPVPLLLLVLLAVLVLSVPVPTITALAAPKGRPGAIELSDGTVVCGRVRFTRGCVLKIHVAAARKTERIAPADVAVFELLPVAESMERPYTFKNPGDPTKTYGEGLYPLRDLTCRVTLRDGRTFEGKPISTIVYIRPEGSDEETRYKLVRQQKGKVGETLDDLVHVRAIRFDDARQPVQPGTVRGLIEADDDLEEIVAHHRKANRIHRGRVLDARTGTYEIKGLPEGTYDVFARTEREFLHPYDMLPAERPEGEEGLVPADREAVQGATVQAADFFEERHVQALAGTLGAARALVLKDRVGKTSYENELQGAKCWRLEIWLWHRLETEWRLDRRLYLFRGTREPDAPARTLRCIAQLGGLEVEAGGILEVGPEIPGATR